MVNRLADALDGITSELSEIASNIKEQTEQLDANNQSANEVVERVMTEFVEELRQQEIRSLERFQDLIDTLRESGVDIPDSMDVQLPAIDPAELRQGEQLLDQAFGSDESDAQKPGSESGEN